MTGGGQRERASKGAAIKGWLGQANSADAPKPVAPQRFLSLADPPHQPQLQIT